MGKNMKIFALTLLTSLLLVSTLSAIIAVNAQGDATVIVLDAIGGTVDPSGTPTYPDGTAVTFLATPVAEGFYFMDWIVVTDTESYHVEGNPATITVAGGVTFVVQAVFRPIEAAVRGRQLPSDMATAAIVVVLVSGGGTTNPAPGRYAMTNAESLMLTATANSGWKFSHWGI